MVDLKGERLIGLLAKVARAVIETEDTTENQENPKSVSSVKTAKPMMVYWEKDKEALENRNQEYIDLYQKGIALERIPDTTGSPVKESRYNFDKISLAYLPDALRNLNEGIPDTPKTSTGISNNGRDAGVIAGIVVGVISGIIILAAVIAVVMYRHYVHRNVTSMNFDNPVYRKTTEDHFALEKNGYAPGSKLYPSTVGEEAQEPLNTSGTNDFV